MIETEAATSLTGKILYPCLHYPTPEAEELQAGSRSLIVLSPRNP